MENLSRQELIAWVNELLKLDINKIEQLGTGAVFCQIFDSVFFDVPMSRVKFNVSSEYQYIQNFKILQSTFTKHRIDRQIPVERLVKCRFQDNLDFLQFSRKYWKENNPGQGYDAVGRRGGSSVASGQLNNSNNFRPNNPHNISNGLRTSGPPTTNNTTTIASTPDLPSTSSSSKSLSASNSKLVSQSSISANRPGQGNSNPIHIRKTSQQQQQQQQQQSPSMTATAPRISRSSPAPGSLNRRQVSNPHMNSNNNSEALANASANAALVINLQRELAKSESLVNALRANEEQVLATASALEVERDFYFHKLRDIEVIVQELTDGLNRLADLQSQPNLTIKKSHNINNENDDPNNWDSKMETDQDDAINDAAAAEADMFVRGINLNDDNDGLIKFVSEVREILYATADGFEVPGEGEVMDGSSGGALNNLDNMDDDGVF